MEKLADIAAFETIQNNAHAAMGYTGIGVFNSYSEAEKKERIEQIEKELEELRQQAGPRFEQAKAARKEMEAKLATARDNLGAIAAEKGIEEANRTYAKYARELEQERAENHFWPDREMRERATALHARLEQLKSDDTEGAFIDKCLDLENRLNEFESQIKQAEGMPLPFWGISNLAAFR